MTLVKAHGLACFGFLRNHTKLVMLITISKISKVILFRISMLF